ncbi:orofacial cleft 1 candidate gene 1 protein isoform X2 [Neopelma chrysocephalum]|uniref:orofacial cleft 1 candidate gene 1 protein isoform X2 n=1 Tax=Neopelma chrysocephalum TaxID=114329 RepID=UPI000FCD12DB|nr:orofacial cleft 1 candidate gene 1 protein isoform X2 [Neopelma chrysocephalum]
MEKEKFQQKALKQTKQKKSKSAEFLMVKEERAATEGIENPAFNISSTDLSAYQPSEEKVIRHDKPDSTLAAHQQKLGLQAHAEPRGNEYSRNYFDPLMDEEINPRQCGMEVSEEDPVKSDEQILYSKLMKLLDEENKMLDFQAAHVVSEDFPESVMPVSSSKACDLHRELEDEEIPSYIEQFERDVQDDIILLGSFSLEQHHKEASHHKKQKWRARIHELLQRLGSQPLKTEENGREEEMVASFGNLANVNTGLNGAAAGPCKKVDYSKKSQSIEIHFKCLRGVKDKVPKGHYTLKVSVLSRLGGGLLERPELKEQPQARTTQPVTHGGNFYNTEIYFGQSIQTVLPHRKAMKPGMVLLFELFLLRGTYAWIDQEVGWGAFPLCDNNFNALEGKFKCPFLRGHYDPKVDRFKKIENFISQDLDHWLCNLYFQITKLPQDSDKQSKCDMHLHLPPELHMYSSVDEKNDVSEKVVQSGPQGQPLTSPKDPDTHKGSIPTVVKEVEKQFNAAKGGEVCVSEEAGRKREELKMLPAEDYQDCHGSADEHCDLFWPKEVQGGHRKINWNNPPDQCHEERSGPENNASQEEEKTSVESNFYLEELEKYTFSVCCHSAAEVKLYRQVVEHFHFAAYTVFSELGATHWCSRDFWLLTLLVVLLWFMRLYLHYLSQWLFLQTISVPVTKFQLFPHTVELCYQNSLLHTSEELVMVVVGPLTLNAGLLLMVLIRWGCQQLFDSFPSFLSKFIIAVGLWTVLDPLAVLVVDSFLGRFGNSVDKPIADAAKLSWVFLRAEESGVPGALITVMLYTVLFMISSTVLYLYFLRLHSEGWLLDVFRRIHGEEGTFFVPLDLEISSQELSYIMKRAEQWRGINGERRMVAVSDYIWKDHASQPGVSSCDLQHQDEIPDSAASLKGSTTVHVSVYTVHLSGFQELYRHFLRLPDGAIIEAFGDISEENLLCNEMNTAHKEHISEMDNVLYTFTRIKLRERKKSTARKSSCL